MIYKYTWGTCTSPPFSEQSKQDYIGFVDLMSFDSKDDHDWILGIDKLEEYWEEKERTSE